MEDIFKNTSIEEFREVIDSVLVNLLEDELPKNIIQRNSLSIKDEIRDLLCSTCCDIDKIKCMLLDHDYEIEKVEYICTAIENRKTELVYLILIYHNSKVNETVATFNWAVKLVLGSSEMHNLKYPILQLSFTTLTNQGEIKERLYEIDKKILGSLISALEKLDV